MLAAAEAGGGELPRQFKLPTVDRPDDFGTRPHITLSASEGPGEAIDLGWFEGEPLVGQARALAGFAADCADAEGVTFVAKVNATRHTSSRCFIRCAPFDLFTWNC